MVIFGLSANKADGGRNELAVKRVLVGMGATLEEGGELWVVLVVDPSVYAFEGNSQVWTFT